MKTTDRTWFSKMLRPFSVVLSILMSYSTAPSAGTALEEQWQSLEEVLDDVMAVNVLGFQAMEQCDRRETPFLS